MQLKTKLIYLALMFNLSISLTNAEEPKKLESTGTVDALIKHGIMEYQQKMQKYDTAPQTSTSSKSTVTYTPQKASKFPALPRYVGYISDGKTVQAEIHYKGDVRAYKKNARLPLNYKLHKITPEYIQLKTSSGNITKMTMRSVKSINQEQYLSTIANQSNNRARFGR